MQQYTELKRGKGALEGGGGRERGRQERELERGKKGWRQALQTASPARETRDVAGVSLSHTTIKVLVSFFPLLPG